MIYKKMLSLILCVSMLTNVCMVSHASENYNTITQPCCNFSKCREEIIEKLKNGENFALENNICGEPGRIIGYFSFTNSALQKLIEYVTPEMTWDEFEKVKNDAIKLEKVKSLKRNKILKIVSIITPTIITFFSYKKLNKTSKSKKIDASANNEGKKLINQVNNTVNREKLTEEENNKNAAHSKNILSIKDKVINSTISLLFGTIVGFFLFNILHFVTDCIYASNIPSEENFYNKFNDKIFLHKCLSNITKYNFWKDSDSIFLNINPENYGSIPTQVALSNIGLNVNDSESKKRELIENLKKLLQDINVKYDYDEYK